MYVWLVQGRSPLFRFVLVVDARVVFDILNTLVVPLGAPTTMKYDCGVTETVPIFPVVVFTGNGKSLWAEFALCTWFHAAFDACEPNW